MLILILILLCSMFLGRGLSFKCLIGVVVFLVILVVLSMLMKLMRVEFVLWLFLMKIVVVLVLCGRMIFVVCW